MLCACWERYIEQVLLESVRYLVGKLNDPGSLGTSVKKFLSDTVRNSKNELQPFKLAGDGWRGILTSCAANETDRLNTPNSENIDQLFKRYLGISVFFRLLVCRSIRDKRFC